MKFNAPSKSLYNLVSAVSKVINSKNALAILNNFHFELSEGKLTIKASDSDNTLVGWMPVTETEGEGSFCIDARRMVEMLKELPDQGISFEINDNTLEVKVNYSNGFYNTVATPGSEYPSRSRNIELGDLTGVADSLEFTTTMQQIGAGIEKTIFAVSSDDSHPQMTGILWDVKEDGIIFVATDTRKLVRYSDRTSAPGVTCSFILPFKADTILRNVFAGDDLVKITVSQRNVRFDSESFSFECVLIKGNFPDYNRVIPTANPYLLTVDRQSFQAAVRRVNSFVDANNGKVTFNISQSILQMKAQDSNFNTSGEESVACSFTGQNMKIAFSAPYMIDILSVMTTDEIDIRLADQSRAAVITPSENAENTDLLMLLMPMYVQDF